MIVSTYLDITLAVLVSVAAFTDLYKRKIPNILLLIGFCSALILHLLSSNPLNAVLWALAGSVTGFLIFLPLYCLRGMAAGDVKFMTVVGFFYNPIITMNIALVAVFVGGFMSLAVLLANIHKTSRKNIPYGVAIATGVWFVIAKYYLQVSLTWLL